MVKKRKDKLTATMLAVFLVFWTWLYTYGRDKVKFWIGLTICIFGFWMLFIPCIAVWIWAIVDAASKDEKWYRNYYKGL